MTDQMNSIENLIGSAGSDVLVGDGNANVLSGGLGTDYLYGQDGNDTLIGGSATPGSANQLWGGSGSDTASYIGTSGAVFADLAAQAAYVDGTLVDLMNSIENLTGGSNADTLVGNAGSNRLSGGAGGDALWGRGGADVFVYTGYADSNLVTGYDMIGDFVSGTSKLDLTALGLDASHVVIQSGGGATSLYIEKTAGTFDAATDLAIALVGANAINMGDILF
jgi:Ca2+-binding RTX toxin-like protein